MDTANIIVDEQRLELSDEKNTNWCYDSLKGNECLIQVRICPVVTDGELNNSRDYLIEVKPRDCPSKWEVQRSRKDFLELEEYFRISEELRPLSDLVPPLPEISEDDPRSLSKFLQLLLLRLGDFIWSCPRILSFLDDAHSKQTIRDAHLATLTGKVQGLTAAYRALEMKLYDLQDNWDSMSVRLLRLENSSLDQGAGPDDDEAADDLAEPNYETIIALHNESHDANVNDLFSPTDSDGLIPVGTMAPHSCDSLQGPDRAHLGEGALVGEDAVAQSMQVPTVASTLVLSRAIFPQAVPTTVQPDSEAPAEHSECLKKSSAPGNESSRELLLPASPTPSIKISEATDVPFNDVETVTPSCEAVMVEGKSTDDSGALSPKSDLEQLRELVADVVPATRPEPPRVHSYKACKHLHASLIPENESPDSRDVSMDAVLSLLKPNDAQLMYRSSARAFLGRAVRHSLNAKLFESGLHALKAFLPDDPIRLTVLLWRGNSTNWLANLSDKLGVLEQPGVRPLGSVGSGAMNINGGAQFNDDTYYENGTDIDNEPKPTGEHIITSINPSTNNGHSRMLCTIDAVPVEIMPNGRSDLCFLALIEEISQLVGKNDLFKCSLLLIRGWWTYESSAYVGVATKNFISDSVLCVLVCSIFNQYHAVINQPLQALCVFLAEYSDVKWGDVAVTLQGIVPFHSKSVLDNQPWLREPLPSELVTIAILQKHCDFYHMSSASTSRASATPQVTEVAGPKVTSEFYSKDEGSKETPRTSGITTVCGTPFSNETPSYELMTQQSLSTIISGTTTRMTPPSSAPPTPGIATPYGLCTASTAATVAAAAALLTVKAAQPSIKRVYSDSHCYSPTAVRNFQKRIFNVVHPLTNANMISNSLNLERVTKISQIFEIGAKDLSTALKQAERNCAEGVTATTGNTHFNSFFRNILGRFSGGWRPDIFNNMLPSKQLSFESGLSSISSGAAFAGITLSSLCDQIRYIDLVLVGRVSESALLALSLDILVGRGVLPVGEIGKSLQDIAPTRNLSGKIKEKYGGLKKFLERYPDDVVICADHPFNPHVFLRKPLNRGDLELIAKGIIPPHLRKAMALRNKMRGGSVGDGHVNSNYHDGNGAMRHSNPNMERNLNLGGMNLQNGYGSHGNMGGNTHGQGQGQGQGMNTRISQQVQQQAFKTQQQALSQQQLFAHQQSQGGQGQYRGQGQEPALHSYNSQGVGVSQGQGPGQVNPQFFFPMRDGDQMIGSRGSMGDQLLMPPQMGTNQPSSGLVGGLLGQEYSGISQSQVRRATVGGINGMGLDLNMNATLSEPFGAFRFRRNGTAESAHSSLLGEGLGLGRSLSSFNGVMDGGQMRRYGEITLPTGTLGLSGESLSHVGSVYDLVGQDRASERRFTEPFRDHSENLLTGGFNPSPSLSLSGKSSRRTSASIQQAAKSFSEREKSERDTGLGIEPWGEPLYSVERDREDRYMESDFNLDASSDLFTSSVLGPPSQALSEESPSEYYDSRTQRGYQQSMSLSRDPYLRGLSSPQEHHPHHQGLGQGTLQPTSSLFLQQRDEELLYEQEYSLRDRQQQLQQRQHDDDEQQQRLILQNQQAGAQRHGFRPTQNTFDPQKWI